MSKKKAAKKKAAKVTVAALLKKIGTLERRVDITRERVDKGPSHNDWEGW